MKSKALICTVLAAVMATCLFTAVWAKPPTYQMTTDIPVSITTPAQVNTSIGALEFFDGVPTKNTVDTVYDYVDRARAVEVFINMIPAVSMYHLRQGMRDIGLTEANQIVIAEEMGDSKPLGADLEQHLALHLGLSGSQERRSDGRRAAPRGAGRLQRHVLPLHERHRRGRPRQG